MAIPLATLENPINLPTNPVLSADLERTDRRCMLALAAIIMIGFFLGTTGLVAWYYAHYLPHYDSVGSYTYMARVVQVMRAEGPEAGWAYAAEYHLAWLQSMFAAALAYVLPPTPAGFQLLNCLCVGVFFTSVYLAARELGATRSKALVMALVIFLPQTLVRWDGGYQDMKREAGFLALLGASFFLTLWFFWNPSWRRGLFLGLITGLCVWSRGNALPYLVVVLGPMVLVGLIQGFRQQRGRSLLAGLTLTALVFGVVAGPNLYWTLEGTLGRHLDPLTCYGRTAEIRASLRYYLRAPLELWATADPGAGNVQLRKWSFAYSLLATGMLLALVWWLLKARFQVSVLWQRRSLALVAAGLWAVVSTLVLICGLVGWDPNFGYAGMHPLYPVLLGPMAILLVLLAALQAGEVCDLAGLRRRWIAAASLGLVMLGVTLHRMYLKAPPYQEIGRLEKLHQLFDLIRGQKKDAVLVFLSHERINIDTLRFYEAQHGYHSQNHLRRLDWQLPTGQWIDTAAPTLPDMNIVEFQQAILRQTQENADFVVLNADPQFYQKPPDVLNFFIFRHGAPIAEALLADPDLEEIYRYELGGPSDREQTFVVLRNKRRMNSPGQQLVGTD